jgi:hypothetical protein
VLDQHEATVAVGVPPVVVTSPIAADGVVFVDVPEDLRETEPHRAPRRQFIVAVSGTFEVETSDGEVRQFAPGSVVLVEDTDGIGHISRVSAPPARFLMIPLAE